MNKSKIQKFAVDGHKLLYKQIAQRAYQYGIEEGNVGKADATEVRGRILSSIEKSQRATLVAEINAKGYQQTIERVTYIWFNRIVALRFMEVNNYLPSHIRVFSDASGAFKPEILNDVLHLEMEGLDKAQVAEYIENNNSEELYRYLLLTQCAELKAALPDVFGLAQRDRDYTELLFPNNMLHQDSFIGKVVNDIDEVDWGTAENWQNSDSDHLVQIIGWLYQYYNSELKDDTFAQLKKNVKITKERIPAATQLFTPDWIVRYMVENSLGRLWLEGHPNAELHDGWKYYLDEAEQEPEVDAQLAKLREECKTISPDKIKVIDPCMGSGHILVYAFDVLMQIYTSAGWNQREAVQSILKNNLYGLDIDDRAAQLAYFAVMMKARQYDRRLLTREIQPNIYAIHESNSIQAMTIEYFHKNDPKLKADIERIVTEMRDAKEYGSILDITPVDFAGLYTRFAEIDNDINVMRKPALDELLPLVKCAELLAQKYDVVVTNPPYMGSSGMNARLSQYVKDHFPDTKADLFSCFIERGFQLANVQGFVSMITMESWMFLSSFEKMRQNIVNTHTIVNMVHMPYLGKGGTSLGINFGTAAVIFNKRYCRDYKSKFDYICYYETDEDGVPFAFPTINERYKATKATNFSKIPGSPVAYWVSYAMIHAFNVGTALSSIASPKQGMATADNNRFVRKWYEPDFRKVALPFSADLKWYPYNNGGGFRRWFGFNTDVVNWENNGAAIKAFPKAYVRNERDYFKSGITWNAITSSDISVRYFNSGYIFSNAGMGIFSDEHNLMLILSFINSAVAKSILSAISPTLNYNAGDIANLPIIASEDHDVQVVTTCKDCIQRSKDDWDSYETSWDFKRNPLV